MHQNLQVRILQVGETIQSPGRTETHRLESLHLEGCLLNPHSAARGRLPVSTTPKAFITNNQLYRSLLQQKELPPPRL